MVHLILLATPGHLDELLLLPPVLQARVEVSGRQAEEALVLVGGGGLAWGGGREYLAPGSLGGELPGCLCCRWGNMACSQGLGEAARKKQERHLVEREEQGAGSRRSRGSRRNRSRMGQTIWSERAGPCG